MSTSSDHRVLLQIVVVLAIASATIAWTVFVSASYRTPPMRMAPIGAVHEHE